MKIECVHGCVTGSNAEQQKKNCILKKVLKKEKNKNSFKKWKKKHIYTTEFGALQNRVECVLWITSYLGLWKNKFTRDMTKWKETDPIKMTI